MLVYLIHEYRGNGTPQSYHANFERVSAIAREITSQNPDTIVISPIHAFSFLGDDRDVRHFALKKCLELQKQVHDAGGESWIVGRRVYQSEGCRREICAAYHYGQGHLVPKLRYMQTTAQDAAQLVQKIIEEEQVNAKAGA